MLSPTETAVLQFSGGKDSTALLYLARPHLDRITVLFVDTDAIYPHVIEFVHETCRALGARLGVVKREEGVLEYTERTGLPADIVPIESLEAVRPMLRDPPGQLLQGYLACCSRMIFEPMMDAVRASGAKIVLRGSKQCDARVGVPDGHVEGGIEYRSPLWNWSDDDVFAYLKREGVELPAHYTEVNDSLDCWCCSAHLAHHGAEKLRWTKTHYPDLYTIAAERIGRVERAVKSQLSRIGDAFKEAAQ